MKTPSLPRLHRAGMTLAEIMVATGVLSLLGLVFFTVLQSGMTLSAKNTAVNVAHENARQGVVRLTRDLHASISVPQLREIDYSVINPSASPGASPSATPPTAPGVSFQNISSGPNYVWQDPGNPNLIMIKDNPGPPIQGMQLIIPFFGIEEDIVKITASGTTNHSNVFSKRAAEATIKPPPYSGSTYAITYYTSRAMYLVQGGNYVADLSGNFTLVAGQYVEVPPGTGQFRYENGELHFYQWRSTSNDSSITGTLFWKDTAVVAHGLTSPRPFSVPLNRSGGPDNRYIKVRLSARDPKSTNRGFLATSSLLDTQIDYRSRITTFQ